MTRQEQVDFVNQLVENVRKNIVSKLPSVPDTWDGHELRSYVSDKFSDCVIKGTLKGASLRDFKNTIIVKNL